MPHKRIPKPAIGILLLFGVTSLCASLLGYYEVSRAKTWTPIDAIVSDCRISLAPEIHESVGGSRPVYHESLIFEFAYTVEGHRYASRNFYAWGQPSTHWVADEYRAGQHFTARYNPKDHTEAVVEPGSVRPLLLVSSFISLGFAAFAMIYNLRRR